MEEKLRVLATKVAAVDAKLDALLEHHKEEAAAREAIGTELHEIYVQLAPMVNSVLGNHARIAKRPRPTVPLALDSMKRARKTKQ